MIKKIPTNTITIAGVVPTACSTRLTAIDKAKNIPGRTIPQSKACASERDAAVAVSNSSTTASGVTTPGTCVAVMTVYGNHPEPTTDHGSRPVHRAQRRRLAPTRRPHRARPAVRSACAGPSRGRRTGRAVPADLGAAVARADVLRRPRPHVAAHHAGCGRERGDLREPTRVAQGLRTVLHRDLSRRGLR